MTRFIAALAATTLGLGLATVVQAQDVAVPPTDTPFVVFSGTAAFATDYRFRGVSLSDRDIAGQASITATTKPGVFFGIWGSSISPIGASFDDQGNQTDSGSHQEIDLSGGYSRTLGPVTPTVGLLGYVYPGGHGVNFYEVYGTVAGNIGPAGLTLGMNYTPKQDNTGHADNLYIYGLVAVAVPGTPFNLTGSVGRENGAFDYGSSSKIDYMGGVSARYKIFTVALQYVGNDLGRAVTQNSPGLRHAAKDGVVFSVTAGF